MKNISTKIKIIGIISICLWIVGTFLIYSETNGKGVSIVTAVIIIAGLYSQIRKDQIESSKSQKIDFTSYISFLFGKNQIELIKIGFDFLARIVFIDWVDFLPATDKNADQGTCSLKRIAKVGKTGNRCTSPQFLKNRSI